MADKFDYALLSGAAYPRTDANKIKLNDPYSGWDSDWKELPELQVPGDDPITGFSAGVYQKGNEIVIAFTGTDEKLWTDFTVANIPAGLGLGSPQILQAMM